ncbi:MAG TPA: 2-amino-4-hydroxy-6-hydroxymethyldihydropteridine diphosphokinase [Deltaproteobacteria bacterium]|jgi:2-amino-4-hydroxy-6-hydroxymethyldihydropteridine diphosphokinase|nr:2-amino-4-hydroxy-6-hydroxymethyldihydropteridine diphosphokinase [Deltaproteobacteria bacterium]HOI06293.1 2-amino-4-hydroxy-6-hydroxymethyldihydropteridine diphosphokinase [Deltaproteobacteria bacterium]
MKGYLCLGSNLGDRLHHIRTALEGLGRSGIEVLTISSIYETLPVGAPEPQENYYNLAAEIEWGGSPLELLHAVHAVEDSLGRQRPYANAPRTMDIDILMLDGVRLESDELSIPHPRMEERAFVICPLAEIAPHIALPSGRYIIDVKNGFSGDEIVRIRTL